MKTLTLQVRTAVQIAPGVYDTEAEYCMIDENFGMYIQTLGFPAAMRNIQPRGVTLHFYGNPDYVYRKEYAYIYPCLIEPGLDIGSGSYPAVLEQDGYERVKHTAADHDCTVAYQNNANLLRKLTDGVFIKSYRPDGNVPVRLYGSASQDHAPWITAEYDEGVLTTFGDSPAGFVLRGSAQTFRWHTGYAGFPAEDVGQTSAVLQWKDGEGGTLHEISISGSGTTYTMAANTLPVSGDILWRVNAVTAEGNSTGQWVHLRTQDALSTPVGVAPSGGYVNGTDAVRFVWRHEIETGTEQTGWEIQVKGTGDWTALASGSGAEQYYDAPAGSVPSGAVQWRVRTLNAQGTAGSWSEPLQIVVIGAPTVTALQAVTASPRPEVTWASPDQQAFQIQMGSYDSGLVFGTQKRFKCPVYLPGTAAEVRVRVINEYRIWSDWAGITVTFANTPGPAPVLAVEAGRDAVLSWEGSANLADGKESTGSNAGVTYTWSNSAKTFTITRTSSNASTSLRTIFGDYGFSNGLRKGETYRFRWSGCSVAGVHFGLQFYNGSTTKSGTAWLENDQTEGLLTIPSSGITGARACLFVESSSSPSGAVVSGLEVYRVRDGYVVFRDGVQIGETDDTTFIDQTAAPGYHSWYVRGFGAGGDDYADSNAVQAEIRTDSVIIAALGGEWIDIGRTATVSDDTGESRSAGVAMLQLAGTVYPVPEVSPRRQRSYQIAFGTEDPAAADRFEELIGKICVLKTRHGRQYVGIMSSVSRSQNWAITRCSATLQEVDESAYS